MDDHLHSWADLERIRSLMTLKAWTNALVNKDQAIWTDITHLRKRVNYMHLTITHACEDASKEGAKFGSKLKHKENGKGKSVAATTIVDNDEDVEEVGISAISGTVDYESNSDMSCCLFCLSLPSLHWNALVWDCNDVPFAPADCLLDCGSQLVLISEAFVQRSNLPRVPLPRPIKINIMIPELPDSATSLKKKNEIVYTSGIALTISLPDNVWSLPFSTC
ncbi:hypothetical protein EST38_g4779 [Candolleomyces aberdarensis]|uniref:Uncharacterized protein n=1 Tax=Candolleomyces aberdarensis TaxID=2316362 RepID=A0A4V1Q471_9AGAR|nr:hypothetical protein EST38_g4779 [Candolleomyces aberdarensis]